MCQPHACRKFQMGLCPAAALILEQTVNAERSALCPGAHLRQPIARR
jgi:hypothetical protein